nr:hypothetical protein [Tanacetum cinerariifolium]
YAFGVAGKGRKRSRATLEDGIEYMQEC